MKIATIKYPARNPLPLIPILLLLAACGSPMINNAMPASYQLSGGLQSGHFAISRIELKFSSGRTDMTVKRGELLQAMAEISFTGQGILRGAWLIDQQIEEQVNINLDHGSHLTVSLKHPFDSATLTPGYHHLSLQLQQPVTSFRLPKLTFFVVAATR